MNFAETKALSDEMNYAATVRLTVPSMALNELQEALFDWTVEGHSVANKIYHRDELYWGEHVERSPELILELNLRDKYSYTLLPSQRAKRGQNWRRLRPKEFVGGKGLGMNGSHRQHGILILSGEGIQRSSLQAGMSDIAPTLLHALNETIPTYMDGTVLEEAFSVQRTPRFYNERTSVSNPEEVSWEEKEAIRKRLEGLGYL